MSFDSTHGKNKKKMTVCIAVFFAAMFLLGALANGTYGMPWDEKTEQAILNANMREYLHCIGLERYIPEYAEAESEYRISTSIEKDHGIAAYYPIGMYILHRDSRPTKEVSYVWQSYTYLVNVLGVLALYGLVTALYGKRLLGMVTAAMYFFTPRMFAEMHFNNKDMVCLTFVLLTLYFGVRWIQNHRVRPAVGFGIAAAFAVNARLIAAFAFGLVGACYLGLYLFDAFAKKTLSDQQRKHFFWQGILAIAVCGVTYVLITPAMWLQPIAYVRYLISNTFHFSRWSGSVLFDGTVYSVPDTLLPRRYLPTMIGITTPVYLLALILVGTVAVWVRPLKEWKEKRFDAETILPAMVSVMWLFPLLLAVGLQTHIYNGWRQFYFIYGPMMVCAASAMEWLFCRLKRFGKGPMRIAAAALAACLVGTAVGIAGNHPYQSGYCNVLAGENAERRYDLDYWHLASGPLMRELVESLPENKQVGIGRVNIWDDHALNAAYKLLTSEQQSRVKKYRGVTTDYVILSLSSLKYLSDKLDPTTPLEEYLLYRAEEQSEDFQELCYVLENFHEHSRAVSYGNTLMILYERNDSSN